MMKRRFIAWATGWGVALASAMALANGVHTFFQENADAGGSFATAEPVTGGPWDGIAGNVGLVIPLPADLADFYFFGLNGGAFNLSFPLCDFCGVAAPIEAILYDAGRTELLEFYYNETRSNVSLPTGNYYLKVFPDLGPGGPDPNYQVLFARVQPDGRPITAPFAAPEPATLALLGLGLAGLAGTRRRKLN